MTDLAFERPAYLPPVNPDRAPVLVAGGVLAIGFLALAALIDLRQAALFLIGGLLGRSRLLGGCFGRG